MATVDLEIASRRYSVACKNGEEDQLRTAAMLVDQKARDAGAALGTMSEGRQLLFASLLLADELKDARNGIAPVAPPPPPPQPAHDPAVGNALERLAERIESLAERLEHDGANA